MPLIHLLFRRGFSPILLLVLFSGHFLLNQQHNSCLAVRYFDGKTIKLTFYFYREVTQSDADYISLESVFFVRHHARLSAD